MGHRHGKNAQVFFSPNPESYFEAKSFRMITLTPFQLKWLERLILYHVKKDNNVQAKLSALQYGFRAGVSVETALHDFMRRVEPKSVDLLENSQLCCKCQLTK